jgi:hypothetical protein
MALVVCKSENTFLGESAGASWLVPHKPPPQLVGRATGEAKGERPAPHAPQDNGSCVCAQWNAQKGTSLVIHNRNEVGAHTLVMADKEDFKEKGLLTEEVCNCVYFDYLHQPAVDYSPLSGCTTYISPY